MMRALRLFGIVLAGLLAACTPDGEAMCEDLVDECNQDIDLSDCRNDVRRLERDADKADCNSTLNSYLQCLDDNLCSWSTSCGAQRDTLESCVGELP